MSQYYKHMIYELSRAGRPGFAVPGSSATPDKYLKELPSGFLRQQQANLPSVSQVDVTRHYTNLSTKNVGIDTCFYPLGSCTMKYNPRLNEGAAALAGFSKVHPYTPDSLAQGLLRIYYELEQDLCEVSGFDAVSLQPAAGAQGELTSLFIIQAYYRDRGDKRDEILVPDSAHGTNPASCTLAGFKSVAVKSGDDGLIDVVDLRSKVNDNTAGMMITNPNTLGLFEENIAEIADILHDRGALLYMDGANFNAIMGYTRPGDFGVDVQHFNLHKTFSTPHGGGGPGCGPIGVKSPLEPFLPVPRVRLHANKFTTDCDAPKSIGRVRQFLGNTGVIIRAYTYLRSLGGEGLKKVSETAVLNANYLLALLRDNFKVPFDRPCMHEFVLDASPQAKDGVTAMDIAKTLLDYGFHPMTVYFPLIVHECMMIEPTETESKATLDSFAAAMLEICDKVQTDKDAFTAAPRSKPVTRLDEVRAAKQPVLRWQPQNNIGE
ncbi:aminomethyl-transferring glycine dehydrogenase subunit GcvPB [Planctomycetota bacterium]